MNRSTPRASRALRQVGRDTASVDTYDSAAFAADQAYFERKMRLRPTPRVAHPQLERVAPGQRKRVVHIRPSAVRAHRAAQNS